MGERFIQNLRLKVAVSLFFFIMKINLLLKKGVVYFNGNIDTGCTHSVTVASFHIFRVASFRILILSSYLSDRNLIASLLDHTKLIFASRRHLFLCRTGKTAPRVFRCAFTSMSASVFPQSNPALIFLMALKLFNKEKLRNILEKIKGITGLVLCSAGLFPFYFT